MSQMSSARGETGDDAAEFPHPHEGRGAVISGKAATTGDSKGLDGPGLKRVPVVTRPRAETAPSVSAILIGVSPEVRTYRQLDV